MEERGGGEEDKRRGGQEERRRRGEEERRRREEERASDRYKFPVRRIFPFDHSETERIILKVAKPV